MNTLFWCGCQPQRSETCCASYVGKGIEERPKSGLLSVAFPLWIVFDHPFDPVTEDDTAFVGECFGSTHHGMACACHAEVVGVLGFVESIVQGVQVGFEVITFEIEVIEEEPDHLVAVIREKAHFVAFCEEDFFVVCQDVGDAFVTIGASGWGDEFPRFDPCLITARFGIEWRTGVIEKVDFDVAKVLLREPPVHAGAEATRTGAGDVDFFDLGKGCSDAAEEGAHIFVTMEVHGFAAAVLEL